MAEVIDATLAGAGKVCDLGSDMTLFLRKFDRWYEDASLIADSVGVKDEKQKLRLVLLWGGRDLRHYAKQAGVICEGEQTDGIAVGVTKIRAEFSKYINESMTLFKLMTAKQGTKSVADFHRELDDLAEECKFDVKPYTKDRAVKDAYIFGTSDEKLRQEALAKDFDLQHVLKAALGYEQSRKSSATIRSANAAAEDVKQMYTKEDVEDVVARVMSGRYSARNQASQQGNKDPPRSRCPNCPPHYRPHGPNRCPAKGKTCSACQQQNHFAGSTNCTQKKATIKRLDETYNYDESCDHVCEVDNIEATSENMVEITINDRRIAMKVDSGCRRTLMPANMYQTDFGPMRESGIQLRPYGTSTILAVAGETDVCLVSANGAKHKSTVYFVHGHLVEPLLGDSDAKALGILQINNGGSQAANVALVTSDLRQNGIVVASGKDIDAETSQDETARIQAIVDAHEDVFNGVGLLANEEVHFHIDHTASPVSAPYRPVAVAYQDQVSEHLAELRRMDKIEDVDLSEYNPWVSNIVLTAKKSGIRMNIDMREPNKALRRTKTHIPTIAEIRHKLNGATRFSEMDMSHGYHQIALAEDSRAISTFRTHEGLHRFKVLFFGAKPASDIFHEKVKTALAGLDGVISIHDNILVWGRTPEEHEKNLDACLQRLIEKGLTLRKEKCTFGKTSVSWFGWKFSKSGISADPEKIRAIKNEGRPSSTEDVKSLLQACQFNARFMFDTDRAYAQLTAPLRRLTHKNATFVWNEDCERAYRDIMSAMTSETALRPFEPGRKLVHIADAGPEGIAASLFQIDGDGTWVPVDHASRSLTECEQRYSQLEREALAQSWGMNVHRHYLLGTKFDAYTDHMPLVGIFNDGKKGNARVERMRMKVQGLDYRMKYMPGKENPCDYASRHPRPLQSYTDTQRERMVIDEGTEICINAVITSDLPDAVTLHMLKFSTARDHIMKKLTAAIEKGRLPSSDPELRPTDRSSTSWRTWTELF